MNKKFADKILKIDKEIIKFNVKLKGFNTMKLESCAKYFIMPKIICNLKWF